MDKLITLKKCYVFVAGVRHLRNRATYHGNATVCWCGDIKPNEESEFSDDPEEYSYSSVCSICEDRFPSQKMLDRPF